MNSTLYSWSHPDYSSKPVALDIQAQFATLFQRFPESGSFDSGNRTHSQNRSWTRTLGIALLALSLGGIVGPLTPMLRLEAGQAVQTAAALNRELLTNNPPPLPPSVPVVFNPLLTPDGASIDPINRDFSLIVPAVGINAAVIPNVDPANYQDYNDALEHGIAHASTSFLPNQDGTMYLFSHSTNYDWFVKDLNAVFYSLKNLEPGENVVVFYQGKQYTYKLREKKVVKPWDISYLIPHAGKKSLILQTCWPPGFTTERLLLFADFVEEAGTAI